MLLAWTLRLGVDADVPAAARKLLADYGVEAMAVGNDQHGRLIALLKSMHSRYQSTPDDAARLVAVGASTPDAGVDVVQAAAWTQVCRVMLNLNEALVRP